MAINYAQWFAQYANSLGLTPEQLQQLQTNVTDPTQEYKFERLLGDINTIGSDANARRERLAQDVRSNAYNSGLADYSTVSEANRVAGRAALNQADRVTYKIVMGPDGRAYRQAFLNNAAAVGRRSWGGSDDKASQWSSKQALNTERAKLQDAFSTSQNDTLTKQGEDERGVQDSLLTGVMDYGKWKVQNMPQSPAGQAAEAAPGDAPSPDAPAAPAARSFVWEGQHDPRKSKKGTATLNSRYKAGKWVVKRRGPNAKSKYVVVLR